MKAINKVILGIGVGLGLSVGLMTTSANAFLCPIVRDDDRTLLFTTQFTNRLLTLLAEHEIVSSKEEELKIWETRKRFKDDSEKEGSESGESKEQFPKAIYYEYMKNATATGSEKYMEAQSDASSQEEYVRNNLFYDSDVSKLTEADKQKVINRRLSYVEALASEILSLSAGVRDSIRSELNILKEAKTTAGGVIQQVDLLVQTKKVMVEQKAADILLQAKLLELDAARLILGLNPQRVENPDETK